ncbi:uncharacterized protein BDW43DRAFT_314700 [Aspergillus alliaceus]|uniref:uncharacterized protein n=1 Tax=Petromyces alliaceus TaxID=209559 RepID=UPI0012A69803|nr:uncharacterized protein BDW43DRAFT_314700 [Aspergillus alliaceus]KAB8229665.1 hypothetical protein BDW43DRAFT_314700 [Aspergillus alliaceus]
MSSMISSHIVACLTQLQHVLSSGSLPDYEAEVPCAFWHDELGRLRLWSANIGAHQTNQSSLDYRLRDASHIKDQVIRQLDRLQRITEDIQLGLEEQLLEELSGTDSEKEEEGTLFQSFYHDLKDCINGLYQMAILIQKPAPHDRLAGIKRQDFSYFQTYDRQHVFHKFPKAIAVIGNRLATANSKRRALLKYRERHRRKLGQGLDNQTDTASATVATTFDAQIHNQYEIQSNHSMTSYDPTILHGEQGLATPPLPEESANESPFECPYCYHIIVIRDTKSWMRHIFSDILPYVCTFTDCETPDILYERRRDWITHMRNKHSRTTKDVAFYYCALCRERFMRGSPIEKHLQRHLEELALFIVPSNVTQEMDQTPQNIIQTDVLDATRPPSPEDTSIGSDIVEYEQMVGTSDPNNDPDKRSLPGSITDHHDMPPNHSTQNKAMKKESKPIDPARAEGEHFNA